MSKANYFDKAALALVRTTPEFQRKAVVALACQFRDESGRFNVNQHDVKKAIARAESEVQK